MKEDTATALLSGSSGEERIVAVEHHEGAESDEMLVFVRDGDATSVRRVPFEPFIVADPACLEGCPARFIRTELKGGRLSALALFKTWKECRQALAWLSRSTRAAMADPNAPYYSPNDPVQQFLMLTGRVLFLGMHFRELKRLQFDIECFTTEGYEFCNAARPGDRIIAIALCDADGHSEVLSGAEMDERTLIERFVALVKEKDPDVIEGHNLFNFDLPYIRERAKLNKVRLALGRDGSAPRVRSSRFVAGGRTIAFERFDIYGRHIVDTLFLLQAYDVSHRSLSGFGLKEAAIHFGIAPEGRTYMPQGSELLVHLIWVMLR